jgi:hypothetical protein
MIFFGRRPENEGNFNEKSQNFLQKSDHFFKIFLRKCDFFFEIFLQKSDYNLLDFEFS